MVDVVVVVVVRDGHFVAGIERFAHFQRIDAGATVSIQRVLAFVATSRPHQNTPVGHRRRNHRHRGHTDHVDAGALAFRHRQWAGLVRLQLGRTASRHRLQRLFAGELLLGGARTTSHTCGGLLGTAAASVVFVLVLVFQLLETDQHLVGFGVLRFGGTTSGRRLARFRATLAFLVNTAELACGAGAVFLLRTLDGDVV